MRGVLSTAREAGSGEGVTHLFFCVCQHVHASNKAFVPKAMCVLFVFGVQAGQESAEVLLRGEASHAALALPVAEFFRSNAARMLGAQLEPLLLRPDKPSQKLLSTSSSDRSLSPWFALCLPSGLPLDQEGGKQGKYKKFPKMRYEMGADL